MHFNQSFVRRYLLLLAAFLGAFALFSLFASLYLLPEMTYFDVFYRACAFFGTPLLAFALMKVVSEDKDSESKIVQHNMCLFLVSVTIVSFGIIIALASR